MTALSPEEFDHQVKDDQKTLQTLSGQKVEGLAYPCGLYDDRVLSRLKALGVKYARTIENTHGFSLPEDFLRWRPTCHDHDPLLPKLAREFLQEDGELKLFYVWGHSFELDKDDCDRWAALEAFCQSLCGREDIWYATNLEICDYVTAYRQLQTEGGQVLNPSSIPLYVEIDGQREILAPRGL